MYSKYTAHITSNGSQKYKVSKFGYDWTKLKVTIYSMNTAHISSKGSHFLTAGVVVYWTYKVNKNPA